MDRDKTYSAVLPVAIVFVGHYVYCVIEKVLAYQDDSFALSQRQGTSINEYTAKGRHRLDEWIAAAWVISSAAAFTGADLMPQHSVDRFVIDTSIFTNPLVFKQFGEEFQAAAMVFLSLAAHSGIEFYMPTAVYEELRKMKNLGAIEADFERVVKIRSPRRLNLSIPSELLYEFIEEVRMRIDKGLKIAEEWTRRAVAEGGGDIGVSIAKLRERYREAMRRGLIDSKEDADLFLLAYELDGTLVSADEGLKKWADRAGVKLLNALNLRRILEGLVEDKATT
jgi:RNA ligase partner protein